MYITEILCRSPFATYLQCQPLQISIIQDSASLVLQSGHSAIGGLADNQTELVHVADDVVGFRRLGDRSQVHACWGGGWGWEWSECVCVFTALTSVTLTLTLRVCIYCTDQRRDRRSRAAQTER